MKKKAAYLIILILLAPLSSLGQSIGYDDVPPNNSKTEVELERIIILEKNSQTEEVILDITQKTYQLELQILSSVSNGKVLIEFYDAKETKQGNFTVGTLLNSEKKEMVHGRIRKSILLPQPGKWKIKIVPMDATGEIKIHSTILLVEPYKK